MNDNVVSFPNGKKDEASPTERTVTPETIMAAADGKYTELILVGKTKDTKRYEVVSTMDIPETLYHIGRIEHRLNMFLDGS